MYQQDFFNTITRPQKHVFEIGPTPHGEKCAQFGKPGFSDLNKFECELYREQLKRMFPEQCEIVSLVITKNPYEGEYYREVAVQFWDDHSDIEAAAQAATFIEDNSPEFWDDEANAKLAQYHTEQIRALHVSQPKETKLKINKTGTI